MLPDNPEHTIPLFAEELHVAKREVISDQLVITTRVSEREVRIEESVQRGNLHIERVALDRAVAVAPEPRHEGDTLIIAIVEERLVVEKRLFVIEELRIVRSSTTEQVSLSETVRTMGASVERVQSVPATGETIDG